MKPNTSTAYSDNRWDTVPNRFEYPSEPAALRSTFPTELLREPVWCGPDCFDQDGSHTGHGSAHKKGPDVTVTREGNLFLFEPLTEAARIWFENNLPGENTWWAGSLVVEHRYAADLAAGLRAEGLEVK